MKWPIFFTLLLAGNLAFAQKFSFPKLLAQSDKINNLVPKNWKILDSAYGDLNHDQQRDLVLILEYHQAVDEDRAYGNYEIELIRETQKPRMLAVYFKTGSRYRLALQNNDFILRSEEGGKMGEPLRGLRVEENKLNLSFEGGNEWRWKLNYQFEYLQKQWNLVTANNVYYHKDTGEMVDKQYDFVDRTIKTVVGSIFKRNISNETEEDILVFSQPRTLSDFKKPWTWEVTKDNYL
ncbi:hypothetical protein [Pedobacter sp.]|uniref:hypothetical protein n=1 Tax=Pedobacter sp. TaxID=1411316 RepID=UPI0031D2DAA4